MRKAMFILIPITMVFLLPGIALGEEPVRRIKQSYLPDSARLVHLDLSFGDIAVEGSDGANVEAEVELFCNRDNEMACRNRSDRLRLVARIKGKKLTIKTKGTPRGRLTGIQARMVVRIPKDLAVEIDLRAGNVAVTGMRSSVEIDAPSGDVEIAYPQRTVGKVALDVGIGSANLWLADGSRLKGDGFPRTVDWQSDGSAFINVNVGTGDIEVRLQ